MNPHILIGMIATGAIVISTLIFNSIPTQAHVQYEQACKERAKQQFVKSYQGIVAYKANQEKCKVVAEILHPTN